jgi:hypothetical protein
MSQSPRPPAPVSSSFEPFLDLVEHLGLQAAGVGRPLLQEVEAARVGQAEEVVLGRVASPASRRDSAEYGFFSSVGL